MDSEKKQTAVDWLINEIDMQYPLLNIKGKAWMVDKAREMEKEQRCVKCFMDGNSNFFCSRHEYEYQNFKNK